MKPSHFELFWAEDAAAHIKHLDPYKYDIFKYREQKIETWFHEHDEKTAESILDAIKIADALLCDFPQSRKSNKELLPSGNTGRPIKITRLELIKWLKTREMDTTQFSRKSDIKIGSDDDIIIFLKDVLNGELQQFHRFRICILTAYHVYQNPKEKRQRKEYTNQFIDEYLKSDHQDYLHRYVYNEKGSRLIQHISYIATDTPKN